MAKTYCVRVCDKLGLLVKPHQMSFCFKQIHTVLVGHSSFVRQLLIPTVAEKTHFYAMPSIVACLYAAFKEASKSNKPRREEVADTGHFFLTPAYLMFPL